MGYRPGKRGAVQGNPARAEPGRLGAAAAAAPGGHHARCLRDVDRGGLRRSGYLTGESADLAASRPCRPARGPGRVLPWMTPAPGGCRGVAETLRPGEGHMAVDLSGRTALITG